MNEHDVLYCHNWSVMSEVACFERTSFNTHYENHHWSVMTSFNTHYENHNWSVMTSFNTHYENHNWSVMSEVACFQRTSFNTHYYDNHLQYKKFLGIEN